MKTLSVALPVVLAETESEIKSLPRSSVFIDADGYLSVKYFDTCSFRLTDGGGSPIVIQESKQQ